MPRAPLRKTRSRTQGRSPERGNGETQRLLGISLADRNSATKNHNGPLKSDSKRKSRVKRGTNSPKHCPLGPRRSTGRKMCVHTLATDTANSRKTSLPGGQEKQRTTQNPTNGHRARQETQTRNRRKKTAEARTPTQAQAQKHQERHPTTDTKRKAPNGATPRTQADVPRRTPTTRTKPPKGERKEEKWRRSPTRGGDWSPARPEDP